MASLSRSLSLSLSLFLSLSLCLSRSLSVTPPSPTIHHQHAWLTDRQTDNHHLLLLFQLVFSCFVCSFCLICFVSQHLSKLKQSKIRHGPQKYSHSLSNDVSHSLDGEIRAATSRSRLIPHTHIHIHPSTLPTSRKTNRRMGSDGLAPPGRLPTLREEREKEKRDGAKNKN